ALSAARARLVERDLPGALQALAGLHPVETLGEAIAWLTATWSAPLDGARPRGVEALRKLVTGPTGAFARRALAARALELGDAEALAEALATDPDGTTFAATDRVALGSLVGAGAETLGGAIADL